MESNTLRNKTKRLISILLLVCMLVSVFSVCVEKNTYAATKNGTYVILKSYKDARNTGGYTVYCQAKATFKNGKITKIGKTTFWANPSDDALASARNVKKIINKGGKSITIKAGVTFHGAHGIQYCYYTKTISASDKAWKKS